MSTAPKYPPQPSPIVERDGRVTRPWQLFFQSLIDQAAASGSVSAVTGTSPITSSGGNTPAIGLANSGVSAGSYSLANVTFNAKGLATAASNGFAVTTILHADILTLPTTRVALNIPTPPLGYRIKVIAPVSVHAVIAVAYTGIDATHASMQVETDFGSWVSASIADDTVSGATLLTQLLGTAGDWGMDIPVPLMYAYPPNGDVLPILISGAGNNVGLWLGFDNNLSGDLGGGDAANFLKLTTYYTVEAL